MGRFIESPPYYRISICCAGSAPDRVRSRASKHGRLSRSQVRKPFEAGNSREKGHKAQKGTANGCAAVWLWRERLRISTIVYFIPRSAAAMRRTFLPLLGVRSFGHADCT
jgi:hypothetical protein